MQNQESKDVSLNIRRIRLFANLLLFVAQQAEKGETVITDEMAKENTKQILKGTGFSSHEDLKEFLRTQMKKPNEKTVNPEYSLLKKLGLDLQDGAIVFTK